MQTALRSSNSADPVMYERAGSASSRTLHSYYGGLSCSAYTLGLSVAPVQPISAADLPAPLVGPLRFVPAN